MEDVNMRHRDNDKKKQILDFLNRYSIEKASPISQRNLPGSWVQINLNCTRLPQKARRRRCNN